MLGDPDAGEARAVVLPVQLDGELITRRAARVGARELAPIAASRRLQEREPLGQYG